MQSYCKFTIMKFASFAGINYPTRKIYLNTITVAIVQINIPIPVPLSCHVKPFVRFKIKITFILYEKFEWNSDLTGDIFFFSRTPGSQHAVSNINHGGK